MIFLGIKITAIFESEHLNEEAKESRPNEEDRLYSHWCCACLGLLLGYRAMWQKLQQEYLLTVKRGDMRHTDARLDPSGVHLCSRRRFVQRGCFVAGAKSSWHADG